ncbi:MAG: MFS transporter [Acidimicrobiia bacterium]|nr:MFS transporter [Acidimicrobiia bacterium]
MRRRRNDDPSRVTSKRSLWLVMSALMTCLLLSALDQTIVSTALPTIVGDLGGLDHISWVVTAYLLSSTVSVPLFGKISDLYGRKPMLQITIVVFLVGSVCAGLAQNMLQLILARGLQGVGGGGILAMTFTVLGDIMSPRERSRYTGFFTAVFASASVIGPLVGGFFVDNLSWRWVFYVNLPLGVLCMFVVGRYLLVPAPTERRTIDLVGAALLTIGVTSLLLAAAWGGQDHAWGSPLILMLIAGGATVIVVFILFERRHPEPILPLRMFRDRVFTVCVAMAALLSAVLFAAATFLPLYLQVVKEASATSSGLLLVPMMAGVVVGSNACAPIISRTGRYKIFPVIGVAVAIVGIALLTRIDVDTSRATISVGMGILGLGIGTGMPIVTLAVQNTAAPEDMGAATSGVNFFRSLGGAFGVAVFGTIMSTRLTSTLDERFPGTNLIDNDELLSSPERIRALPVEQFDAVADGVASGVSTVFVVALPLIVLAWVLAIVLEDVPLRGEFDVRASMVEGLEEADAHAQ